ncbi:MAG: hypothetical protein BMS9Abin05_1835 [Rhodothermia bacterium]|nr:MAG: hypothetical protein BMS9Abin05_1835 [Rhodothermia bacterium]
MLDGETPDPYSAGGGNVYRTRSIGITPVTAGADFFTI